MLEISYTTGHGHGKMTINLDALLPCSRQDFRRLLDTVNLSEQSADHAEMIYKHIAERVVELKKQRETIDAEREKSELAKVNAEIKRFLWLAGMLAKECGTPEIADTDASIKLKAATVYALRTNAAGKPEAQEMGGWTFEKAGYIFDVYKDQRGKYDYCILVHDTGLQIATAAKKTEIVASVTPRLLDLLNKNPQKIADAKETFRRYMIAAGFMDAEPEHENENNESKEDETMKKNENKNNINYFAGVKTLEDLRTVYKNLLKENHPDNGGDVAAMQEINAQYDKAFAALKAGAKLDDEKEKIKWSEAEDAAIREALYKVVFLHGLNIEIVGCWIWVDGDTYANKDALKEAGYKWSNARKKWHYAPYESKWHKGSKKSFDQLRREYGSAEVEKEERAAIA